MIQEIFRLFLKRLGGAGGERQHNGRWDTIPNRITLAGFAAIGFYCYLFLTGSWIWAIPLLHVVILLSDLLDGLAADWLNQHSKLGRYLDPLRDRVHAIALYTNFVLMAADDMWFVLAAFAVAITAEVWVSVLAHRRLIDDVLSVGKARAGIYYLFGFVALVQMYWIGDEIIPLFVIACIMATASAMSAISYTLDYVRRSKKETPET